MANGNIDVQHQTENPEIQQLTQQYQNDPQFKDFKTMLDQRCDISNEIGLQEMKAGIQMYENMKDNPDMVQVSKIFMQEMNFSLSAMNRDNFLKNWLEPIAQR